MKKESKSVFVCLAIIFTFSFAACSEPKAYTETNITSVEKTGDTAELRPELPDSDFEGHIFKIIHYKISDWPIGGFNRDIYAEQEIGESINDAVYRRNLTVEEKYNINIEIENTEYSTIKSVIQKAVSANDDVYDLSYVRLYEVPSLITGGYLTDLNKLGYVDFSNPWWDQNSVDDLSINNKLYLAATDINIMDKDATYCVLFNKDLAADYNLPNLYETVDNKEWTVDKMLELSAGVTTDIDGDGKQTKEDLYGIMGRHDATGALFRGAGCLFADKNDDDIPYITFKSEYNFTVVEKIFDLIYDEGYLNLHTDGVTEAEFFDMFAEAKGLFCYFTIMSVSALRSVDLNFGILPIPKYNVEQPLYYNLVSVHWAGLMSVPASSGDLERTGIIAEALSAESKYTLQPAYMEINLKGKSIRDEESEDMLNLIFSNRIYDTGDIFNFADFSYQFLCISGTKSRDIASFYAKYEQKIQAELDKTVEAIMQLD
ncbi:MAG: extracellular solute-binding protein [Eubacteriales bacterium]|nr:extracellular solute-binding protein [Eubacteriales bacterium]